MIARKDGFHFSSHTFFGGTMLITRKGNYVKDLCLIMSGSREVWHISFDFQVHGSWDPHEPKSYFRNRSCVHSQVLVERQW